MPKPTKGARLGGTPTHERMILRNLCMQLFDNGRITTTETKARRMQPLAEKLITKAKRGDLHARRLVLQSVTNEGVVHKLFTEIAPSLEGREGGYTRITKIGPRKGDNAPMAIIEIVTESVADSQAARAKRPSAAKAAEKPAAKKAPKAEAPVADAEAVEPESTEAEGIEEAVAPEAAAAEELAEETRVEEAPAEEAPADDAAADEAAAPADEAEADKA